MESLKPCRICGCTIGVVMVGAIVCAVCRQPEISKLSQQPPYYLEEKLPLGEHPHTEIPDFETVGLSESGHATVTGTTTVPFDMRRLNGKV